MKPSQFFGLLILEILVVVALAQVSLVQDLITSSGYSPSEVYGGILSIALIFDAGMAVRS